MKKGLLEKQIRHIMATDEKSRNSDIRLTQMIWWNYHRSSLSEHNGRTWVDIGALNNLPRESRVTRIRRKIQEGREFLPTDPAIAKKRGWQEDEWRKFIGYPVAGVDGQTL